MPGRHIAIKGICIILGLFLLGIGGTILLDSSNADISWTSTSYIEGGGCGGWVYCKKFPWGLLYDYGELPAWILGIGAAVGLILVRVGRVPASYARPCAAVILAIVIGPGLLVNGVFKNYWGRPRPVDVVGLGGRETFRSVSEPAGPGAGKSFPCGHCAMAFALASGVVFYRLHPAASVGALFGGIAFGIVMGLARMNQGGHFPTDVLWSGIMVMMLIAALYYVVLKIPDRDP
jgi:lipid A 4'-phosphatase